MPFQLKFSENGTALNSHCAQRSLHDERSSGCQKHQWYVTTERQGETEAGGEKKRKKDVEQSVLLLTVADYGGSFT